MWYPSKLFSSATGVLCLWLGLQNAHAQHQPSYATERWIEHIHVAKDWSEHRRLELDLKVLTETGVERIAEQSLPFNPRHESLRIVEAYNRRLFPPSPTC
ncbi:MAG: hypothetical protein QM527_15875 [Alphaproteobacteria bacterium]|nr:hypothetical protein [Alphaproteobacteria bacterium]